MDALSPTIYRRGPYRFFFYAGDRAEPPHVHVEGDGGEAKFWLRPLSLADSWGYSDREVRAIRRIIEEHRNAFLEAWDGFFSG